MMAAPDMAGSRLSALLEGIRAVPPEVDRAVGGLSMDSRRLHAGDCFLACRGQACHGLDFLDAALAAGTVAVLAEEDAGAGVRWHGGVPVVPVADLRARAGTLAARFHGDPSRRMHVIGVTGTNGKTSVSHMLAQALDGRPPWAHCGLMGTLGHGTLARLEPGPTTTPDAVEIQRLLAAMAAEGAGAAVLEVSSHAIDQHRVAAVHLDVAVFTNLSRDHLDYHADMDAYGRAKRALFERPALGAAVINLDDPYGAEILSVCAGIPVYGYTLEDAPAPAFVRRLAAHDLAVGPGGIAMTVAGAHGSDRLSGRLLGRYNAANLLAAYAALLASGLDGADAAARLAQAAPIPGRMEPVPGGAGDPLVVVDYAHTPAALHAALEALRGLTAGRLVCVFGCGGNRDRGKRALMGGVAGELADRVVLTDDNPRREDPSAIIEDILAGVPKTADVEVIRERPAAVQAAIARAAPEDTVLLAGKGHELGQDLGERVVAMADRDLATAALRVRGR